MNHESVEEERDRCRTTGTFPGRTYWPRCVEKQRRQYEKAAAAGALTAFGCAKLAVELYQNLG